MSEALYELGGLRFWTEAEISARDQATETIRLAIVQALSVLNSAWTFHRVDGPLLTPRRHVNAAYTDDDIFALTCKLGDDDAVLRAETTASSYLYAMHLLQSGKTRLPTCIWQAGKSFRRERQDGARAATLRYNEFYQLEFQCIYSDSTKADIRGTVEEAVMRAVHRIACSDEERIVPSDRLPSYSLETNDIETRWKGEMKEVASISTRTDFPKDKTLVLEAAIGLDRLVAILDANMKGLTYDAR